MGIVWSCICKKNTDPEPATTTAPEPDLIGNPDSDGEGVPSSYRHYLNDGDASFLGSNVSGNSWFSMVTTNFTSWISQASGAIAGIWDNNTAEGDEFPAAVPEDDLPDVGPIGIDSKLRAFTFAEMKAATFNFRHDLILGKGGFGTVHKGWLREKVPCKDSGRKRWSREKKPSHVIRKRPIAVKRLDSNSKQGYRQWRTEVSFIGRISHPNIVKLLGYCRENEELLLVYEFMSKGSLNYHLFGKRSTHTLPWLTRVRIMIGMARSLCHLHMMEKPIIYRDFKTSNILLDESYTSKLSDFGLAKWGPTDGSSYVQGHVVGTVGYTDPAYVSTGNLYVKSDVYSFGVVLVEMLTGLRAFDKRRPVLQRNLATYMQDNLADRHFLKTGLDKRLEGKYSLKEACIIGSLAAKCLNPVPQFCPSMMEVTETLEQLQARYNELVN